MKIDKIVDSKITTMTDLSGNKSKVLILKNETEIEAFKKQLRLCSVSNRRELLRAYEKFQDPDQDMKDTEQNISWFLGE